MYNISECIGNNLLTPEPNTPGPEPFTISTPGTILTIITEVDYEVAKEYILVMSVEDLGSNLIGSLVIKVHF